MLYRKTRVRKYERGLVFRDGDFQGIAMPGCHRLWRLPFSRGRRTRIDVRDTLRGSLDHTLLAVIVESEEAQRELRVLDLDASQRALVWHSGKLESMLGPGLWAYWKATPGLEIETYSIDAGRFTHDRLDTVLRHPGASRWLTGVDVDAEEEALLFRDGELIDRLGPGRHIFWTGAGNLTWKSVDLRERVTDVSGQEMLTSDKVTLRMNLSVGFRVVDPQLAVTAVQDHEQTLYREAQLALRAAVGTRTLDALLGNKEALGSEIRAVLAERVGEFGVRVTGVGLRDVILPGDMREIFNSVIEAEKQAQANLIRRREETAAARSQANTAKLLAENPTLARLKELEMLQEILAGARATFVLGSEDLPEQFRRLLASGDERDDAPG